MADPSSFSRPVFLRVFREVYIFVTLHAAAGMAAIAHDLGHILIGGVTTVVAAILCIPADAASAHFVSAFPFVCHFRILLVLSTFPVR
jgi:hypothetical protein